MCAPVRVRTLAGESLRVVAGNAAGTEIALGQVLLIGSGVAGPGSLAGDASLAPEHARITRQPDGRLTVEDLGSTSGTTVNDRQIAGAVAVRAGDTIRVGSSTLQVVDQVGRAPEATSFRQVEAALPTPPPPQDADRQQSTPATGLQPLSLRVIAGRAIGTEIQLGGQLLIGRATTGVGRLGEDPELSREHARITRSQAGEVTLEDLGSTNGTFVNDQRVTSPRALAPGDRIRVGETTLEVAADSSPAARPPSGAHRPAPAPAPARAPAPASSAGSNPALLVAIVVLGIAVVVAILFAAGVI